MSSAVIDASIAVAWCFKDEASPAIDLLYERIRDEGAIVPGLWHLEVSNVLLQAAKRGRISVGDAMDRLDLFAELPITVDPETSTRAWRETFALARTEGLTLYDASYLELAGRLRIDLLTKDFALAKAGRRLGVGIYPS